MSDESAQPVQLAFQSNPSRYSFAGSARLINAYAEKQGDDAKAPLAVLACPGMVSCCAADATPGRGLIYLDDLDKIYAVYSSSVYKVVKTSTSPLTLTATRIGTIPGTDQVQMSRNQAGNVQILVHCAAGEYYIEADTIKKVAATNFTTAPVTADQVSGYTVYGEANGRFNYSAINNLNSVNALDFATAEQYADKMVRIKADGPDMFIFSRKSIEPWRVTSDATLPFQLIGGSVSPKGLVAANAVVSSDNTLMFPGEDNVAYRFNSYSPQRISTHAIERYFEGDTDRENILGMAFAFQGHSFAAWTGSGYTVAYDAATGVWANRESWQNGGKWRFRNPVRAWGYTIGQDALTGNLYYLDANTYAEGSDPMIWGMDTPFVHTAAGTGGIVDALHIDLQTGVGALNSSSQGYDPLLMLSWSTDGGKTFKGNRQLNIGRLGDYKRVTTRRLGRFGRQGIMFRLRISDPVIRGIASISANIRTLKV